MRHDDKVDVLYIAVGIAAGIIVGFLLAGLT